MAETSNHTPKGTPRKRLQVMRVLQLIGHPAICNSSDRLMGVVDIGQTSPPVTTIGIARFGPWARRGFEKRLQI